MKRLSKDGDGLLDFLTISPAFARAADNAVAHVEPPQDVGDDEEYEDGEEEEEEHPVPIEAAETAQGAEGTPSTQSLADQKPAADADEEKKSVDHARNRCKMQAFKKLEGSGMAPERITTLMRKVTFLKLMC